MVGEVRAGMGVPQSSWRWGAEGLRSVEGGLQFLCFIVGWQSNILSDIKLMVLKSVHIITNNSNL